MSMDRMIRNVVRFNLPVRQGVKQFLFIHRYQYMCITHPAVTLFPTINEKTAQEV